MFVWRYELTYNGWGFHHNQKLSTRGSTNSLREKYNILVHERTMDVIQTQHPRCTTTERKRETRLICCRVMMCAAADAGT